MCSRDFCRLAGQLYGAGDELVGEHDRTEAVAAAAHSHAARQARHGDQPPPGGSGHAEETDVAFVAVEAACPHSASRSRC